MQDNRPLEKQFPPEGASKEEILTWAIKARKRIIRDVSAKNALKYKNKKLRGQLAGRDIQVSKLKQKLNEYENPSSTNTQVNIVEWLRCLFTKA